MKTKPKKRFHFERATIFLDETKEEVCTIVFAVLPDHWSKEAVRWKKAADRGVIVRTRSSLASLYREWRQQGGRPRQGVTAFASFIGWLVPKLIGEARLKDRARKEATA